MAITGHLEPHEDRSAGRERRLRSVVERDAVRADERPHVGAHADAFRVPASRRKRGACSRRRRPDRSCPCRRAFAGSCSCRRYPAPPIANGAKRVRTSGERADTRRSVSADRELLNRFRRRDRRGAFGVAADRDAQLRLHVRRLRPPPSSERDRRTPTRPSMPAAARQLARRVEQLRCAAGTGRFRRRLRPQRLPCRSTARRRQARDATPVDCGLREGRRRSSRRARTGRRAR